MQGLLQLRECEETPQAGFFAGLLLTRRTGRNQLFHEPFLFGGGHRTADNSLRADRNRPFVCGAHRHRPHDRSRADRRTLPQRRGGCRAYFQHQQGDALQIAGGGRREVGGVRSGLQTSPANRSVGGRVAIPVRRRWREWTTNGS